jgi:hypothetical protein
MLENFLKTNRAYYDYAISKGLTALAAAIKQSIEKTIANKQVKPKQLKLF